MAGRNVQPSGVHLLWGQRQRPPRGPKPTLSLEQIVDEAVRLADSEGMEALSMQRLASELGVGTMSLYRYVPSKEDLTSLMVDAAIGTPPVIGERTGWRAAMEMWARANLRVFERHPWTLALVTRPRVMGPNEVGYLEVALAALHGTGLEPAEKLNAVLLINGYVRGSAPFLPEREPEEPQMVSWQLLADLGQEERFPNIVEVMAAVADGGAEADIPFEYGLRRVLDGIEARIEPV